MKVRVTQALLDLIRDKRLTIGSSTDGTFQLGATIRVEPNARIEPYSHIFAGTDLPMAMGAFSYSHSILDPWLSIGRYCSIATSVSVMGSDHPSDWASSSLFSYQDATQLSGLVSYLRDIKFPAFNLHRLPPPPSQILIGHDVWIGGGATIKRGIAIGSGAVVGSRSVVTRDVPPYAVVVGVPARVVRYRFPEELMTRLLNSEWWRYGPEVLQPLDVREPAQFLERLEEQINAGLQPLELEPLTGEQVIAAGEALA